MKYTNKIGSGGMIYNAFNDRENLATVYSGHNISHRLLLLTADSRISH
jgi:hypothetical protein